MLRLLSRPVTACDGTTRREVLRAGALSLFGGFSLPQLLRAEAAQPGRREGSAKAVILLNLFGGPSHLDMFDPKPAAPPEVRGEFDSIETSVAGVRICEHLPRTAAALHRATLIRTHSHPYNSHNPYNVLTGFSGGSDRENYFAKPTDHPSMGSVMQYAGLRSTGVPSYVVMPAHPGYSQSLRRAGPYGGYLGAQYDPAITLCEPQFAREADPDKNAYDPIPPIGEPMLPSVDALPDLTVDRLSRRRSLLAQVDDAVARVERSSALTGHNRFQREAFELLTNSRTRQAFDLSGEPADIRARYGQDLYGNCLLAARRLVETGVRFVAVNTESRGAGHWDSHENNFGMLRTYLLPTLDQIYVTLIDDLEQRGLLDTTLVVVMGEMGRSPRVNAKAGRDHWPQCGFVLMTGGGVKRGHVYGRSDPQGAWPADLPVSSGDIVATIYQLLGVDPALTVPDTVGRPIHIAHGGAPIWDVIG
jgi:hypothetical protein